MKKILDTYYEKLFKISNPDQNKFLALSDELIANKINFEQFLNRIKNEKINLSAPYISFYHDKLYHHFKKKELNATETLWELLYKICPEGQEKALIETVSLQNLYDSLNKKSFAYFYLNEIFNKKENDFIKQIENDPKIIKNKNLELIGTEAFIYQLFFEEEFNFRKCKKLIELTPSHTKNSFFNQFNGFLINSYNPNIYEFLEKSDDLFKKNFTEHYSHTLISVVSSYDTLNGLYPEQIKQMYNLINIYENHEFLQNNLIIKKNLTKSILNKKFNFLEKNFDVKNISFMTVIFISNYHQLIKELINNDFWKKDWNDGIKKEPVYALMQGIYGLNKLDRLEINYLNPEFTHGTKYINILSMLGALYKNADDNEKKKFLDAIDKVVSTSPELLMQKFKDGRTVLEMYPDKNLRIKLEQDYLKCISEDNIINKDQKIKLL